MRGPWGGHWPCLHAEDSTLPGAARLLVFLSLCALGLLAALHMYLTASQMEAGRQADPGGLKGLAKSLPVVLWLLGLAGLAALRPRQVLLVWLSGLGYGLLWARLGLSILSAMEPVQQAFSAEKLQLASLAAAV
ncbi:membrane hypothetical protein [Desulfarculales bacterium]